MRFIPIIFLLITVSSGCAVNEVYNPVTAASKGVFLLNESAFAQIRPGMKQEEVHRIMGDSIVIGYAYQKPLSDPHAVSQAASKDYKPLTINNPYKTQEIKTKEGVYLVEYYVRMIDQPDGVINDNELVPLVFRDGLLVAQGWAYLKSWNHSTSL